MNRKEIVGEINKIVVKVGTSSLTTNNGQLNYKNIELIVEELAKLVNSGMKVVLVSSGAVGAGMGAFNIDYKPTSLVEKQAIAAVGQVALMHLYQQLFLKHNIIIGQLLLTKADFANRNRFINARNVCNELLNKRVIPIINENDATVADEIKVGDNDTLSALVVGLIDADLLIILTDIDGLYDQNPANKNAKLISVVEKIDESLYLIAGSEGSKFGTGGMYTKIVAANMATKIGSHLVICQGNNPSNISKVLEYEDIGTLFIKNDKKISSRKYWLAYGTNELGSIVIDDGAINALNNGRSLLPIGVVKVNDNFEVGTIIQILDKNGEVIAKGITNYNSNELNLIKGVNSIEIDKILGYKYDDVVIHIDNLIKL